MIAVLRLGMGLAAIAGLGGVASRLLRADTDCPGYQKAAAWFLLGSGLLSLVMFWVSLVGRRLGLLAAAVPAAAGLLHLLIMVRAMRLGSLIAHLGEEMTLFRLRSLARSSRPLLLLSVAGLFLLAGTVYAAFATGLGWDGLAIWGLKARIFLLEGGVPVSYFHDTSRLWSHLDYPLLVPLTQAWIYVALGQINEVLAKGLFLAFFLSLMALFHGSVDRQHGRRYSLAFTLLLCSTPLVHSGGTSGYADVPLSAFVFGSAAYLYRWLEEERRGSIRLAGLLSALCIWTKREGAVIWVVNMVAVLAWALLARHRPMRSRIGPAVEFVLPALLLGPWFVFSGCQALSTSDVAPMTLGAVSANIGRVPVLAKLLLVKLLSIRYWGTLWVLFALATLYPSARAFSRGERYLLMATLTYIGLLALSYILSVWQPYVRHADTSLARLALHVTPMALFFVAIRLGRTGTASWAWLLGVLPRRVAEWATSPR